MPITEDIDIFIKRCKNEPEFECHVCYETVFKDKCVTCCNGHSCCQIHHLQRIRSIYQEDTLAFGGGDVNESGSGQKCFLCRDRIDDESFSKNFLMNMRLIQAVEIPKMMMRRGCSLEGKTVWTNQDAINMFIGLELEQN